MLKTIPIQALPSWQESLSDLITDPQELLALLALDEKQTGLSLKALQDFPLRVPRPYLSRISPGNPADPLLLQVLPSQQEEHFFPGFSNDPLGESAVNPTPGLLHKYSGRSLLLTTSSCAIHCRYCFRRHFPYEDNRPGKNKWQESLDYIAQDSSVNEVILSGGDPLTLSDKHLAWFINELNTISHIKRLRIHTRLPIMIPHRVNDSLCQLLSKQRFQVVVVIHSNHAQEFDSHVDSACRRLKENGASLLNQSVLLKGVNDSCTALTELSERLFDAGVLPYYLHILDKVTGAGHFDVSIDRARQLIQEIQAQLPGYLVPRLVCENAGQTSKTLIAIE
ncbi:EF-P beta-lysylation protein EpmB [Gammaproteobacteria bacterium]|nr:EF-P beta-lysylation protein EpmB [Gammaproteobacteria bacterium]